jgi:hypothetical protein
VSDLAHKIMTYIRLYNRNAQPFHWTYRNPSKAYSRVTFFGNATLDKAQFGQVLIPAILQA